MYEDLRRAASAQLRRGASPTLNTTSLVNEAYLKLVDGSQAAPSDRSHFLAVAARAMRYIIIDYARQRSAAKRGGDAPHVRLDEARVAIDDEVQQLLTLDDALQALARLDERLVRLAECRYFTGMTEEETAAALDVSVSTVQRDWKRAKGLADRGNAQPRGLRIPGWQEVWAGLLRGVVFVDVEVFESFFATGAFQEDFNALLGVFEC